MWPVTRKGRAIGLRNLESNERGLDRGRLHSAGTKAGGRRPGAKSITVLTDSNAETGCFTG